MFRILNHTQLDSHIEAFMARKARPSADSHIQVQNDGPVHSIRGTGAASKVIEGKKSRELSGFTSDDLFIWSPLS